MNNLDNNKNNEEKDGVDDVDDMEFAFTSDEENTFRLHDFAAFIPFKPFQQLFQPPFQLGVTPDRKK